MSRNSVTEELMEAFVSCNEMSYVPSEHCHSLKADVIFRGTRYRGDSCGKP